MSKWESINENIYSHLTNGVSQEELKRREKAFDDFVKCFELTHSIWDPWCRHWDRFLSGDRSYNAATGWGRNSFGNGVEKHYPPHADHRAAFKKKGTDRIIYAFHPYDIGFPECQKSTDELLYWCKEREIECVIIDKKHSFYNNSSNLVLLMSKKTHQDCEQKINSFN